MTTATGTGELRARVADEVRAWMARRRISGVKLAAAMDRSQPYLAKRLTGRQAFDVDDLEAVAAILDVPIEVLVAGAVPAPRRSDTRAANQQYDRENTRGITRPSRPGPSRPAAGRPPNRPHSPPPPLVTSRRSGVAYVAA